MEDVDKRFSSCLLEQLSFDNALFWLLWCWHIWLCHNGLLQTAVPPGLPQPLARRTGILPPLSRSPLSASPAAAHLPRSLGAPSRHAVPAFNPRAPSTLGLVPGTDSPRGVSGTDAPQPICHRPPGRRRKFRRRRRLHGTLRRTVLRNPYGWTL